MAQPILLPPAFDGMAQDFPRNNLPKGKAWNLVDYIPDHWQPYEGRTSSACTSRSHVRAPFSGGGGGDGRRGGARRESIEHPKASE